MRNLPIHYIKRLIIRANTNMLHKTLPNLIGNVALVNLSFIPKRLPIPLGLSDLADGVLNRNMLNIDRRTNKLRSESLQFLRRVNVKVSAHARSHGHAANTQRLINNLLKNLEGQNRLNMFFNRLMFFKPRLRLLNRPTLTLVKKIALHSGFVFTFQLADNRLDAFLFADRDGSHAVRLKIIRTTMTTTYIISVIFPWHAKGSF